MCQIVYMYGDLIPVTRDKLFLMSRLPAIEWMEFLWQKKCAHYFPPDTEQTQAYGHISVTNKSTTMNQCSIARRVLEVQDIKVFFSSLCVHLFPFPTMIDQSFVL